MYLAVLTKDLVGDHTETWICLANPGEELASEGSRIACDLGVHLAVHARHQCARANMRYTSHLTTCLELVRGAEGVRAVISGFGMTVYHITHDSETHATCWMVRSGLFMQ